VIVTPFNSAVQLPGGLRVAIFRINPAIGGSAPVVLNFRQAVNAWLRSLTALTAIVGSRIYKQDPSQLSSYPCVVVELPKRRYGHNLDGADGTSVAEVKFTAMSLFESDCVNCLEAIRNSLDGYSGYQSGVAIMRCLLDDDSEVDETVPPPDGSDQWIYTASVSYVMAHRVPKPTSVTQTNV
jgi:hypothetical protein